MRVIKRTNIRLTYTIRTSPPAIALGPDIVKA